MFFSTLNQRYDIIKCVFWFEMFSQVSDLAHGPLVLKIGFGIPDIQKTNYAISTGAHI